MPTLARELETSSWTRWDVLGLKHDLWTAPLMHLVFMIAPILKMLESPVKVCVAYVSLVFIFLDGSILGEAHFFVHLADLKISI